MYGELINACFLTVRKSDIRCISNERIKSMYDQWYGVAFIRR